MKNFAILPELLAFQAANFNNPYAFNFKENGQLKSFSNQEFLEISLQFACGLREIGLLENETLANISYQNPIWLMVDLATILAGAVTVPIFNNISKENLFYEISDAQVKYIFTDREEIFEAIRNRNPELKIITYGFNKENSIGFEALISLGKKALEEKKYNFDSLLKIKNPQELATIIYTSGSTGKPKGVELTHANLISQIKAAAEFFPLSSEDVVLSFLPLAHIFERMVIMYYISCGVSIYFVDDLKNIGNSLKEFRPSLMTSVPRVLEKVFARIKEGVENAGFFKKFLGQKAIKRALVKDPEASKNFCDKIFDFLIYRKFRSALGGNMRMVICGGAALSLDLQRFYKNIGITLYCGYGLTETSPVLAVNCYNGNKLGTVGRAFPGVELKVSAEKELLARGPGIMRGYHNQAQKTAEVIEDGWFKTGDLAEIDEQGFVKIIGRKKELFKTANGKYVAPTPIEQKLVQEAGFLLGALLIAEGRKFTSALLFPDFELLGKFKEKFGFSGTDEEFLKSEILQKFVEKIIARINENFDHWEQIQKFYIATSQVSIDTGEITPSMKLKRNVLEEKYKKEIDGFYLE